MASRLVPTPDDYSEDEEDLPSHSLQTATDLDGMYPQKKYYRQRAHVNPLSLQNLRPPSNPDKVDWDELFPGIGGKKVDFLDVGCGYGGLLIELSPLFPDKYILGIEIRIKVMDFVRDRIASLRLQNQGSYRNVSVLRTNAMKYLPNYFVKHQLSKLFFLYPDPHFKRSKHKWRIISPNLLAEYAYVLRIGGILYSATDVLEVHEWIKKHLNEHPLFEALSDVQQEQDPCIPLLTSSTEEAAKVTRNKGNHFVACFIRVEDAKN